MAEASEINDHGKKIKLKHPLIHCDTDNPITEEILRDKFGALRAITLCIRSAEGAEKRGGYFFCLERDDDFQQISLETVEGFKIDTFSLSAVVQFINHVSGLQFDTTILELCQKKINLRDDEETL
ncbi:hypothetical protein [Fibrobacter succinogenes]|uniref:hypothetical protein n=1 Tax=Fibrobacter succinogenes TaxID=833 RepID=UPI0015687464|nr:hypothetical protein [Fibrobacter succinogenes]